MNLNPKEFVLKYLEWSGGAENSAEVTPFKLTNFLCTCFAQFLYKD